MENKPKVKMVGEDGNAFRIMGACLLAAERAGWSKEQVKKVMDEMMQGDYDHLLRTAMKYFEVE